MPPSARQRGTPSTNRTSTTSARQPSNAANALPVYQPLTHPLNPTAQHALQNLPTTHPLNDLKQRLSTATNHLNEVTGDLNDQYQVKKAEFDKQRSQKAARARELESSQGAENDDEDRDRHMQDAWADVENLTGKMEDRTRQVIDIQARVENTETILRELNANVTNGRTSTQSTLGASQFRTQTQRQRRRQRPGHEEDDSEDDDDDDNNAAPEDAPTPALTIFKSKLSTASSDYNSLSMSDRYTSHNTYIGFRQIVHDSRHPNDDTPMPHHSTWFPTANQPTTTAPQANRGNNKHPKPTPPSSEADDEIQIAREKRSIRCPITLLPLSNPLTSTRCPHSFESEAILNMLSASLLRAHNSSNDQNNKPIVNTNPRDKTAVNALKCPECEVLLTKETLRVDAALVRKIKKIAEVERRQQNGDDEDDEEDGGSGAGGGEVEEVTSSPVLSRGKGPQSLKRERMSQMQMASQRQREREVSMVPDSQVVDLGDGEEDGDVDVDVDLGSGEDVEDGDED
ncbi:MAG: hypothetical protein Q9226_002776 [Calogaya cf. arnoldii]